MIHEPPAINLVAMGASDVVGIGAHDPAKEGWAPVMASLLPGKKRLMRLGISGATTHQIRAQLLPRAVAAKPDVAVLWAGVNDCAQQVPLPQFEANMDAIVGGLAATRARVFVLNLPDMTRLPAVRPYAPWVRQVLPAWQQAVRQVAARHGAEVIELTPYSLELEKHPDYLSADGFHPSAKGYRRVAEVVAEAVKASLARLRGA